LEVGLGGGDIWRGRGDAEVSWFELSAFGADDVGRNGSEVVEERGAERRVSDDCFVPGDVKATALGVYVPKNLRVNAYLPLTRVVVIWNISASFGIRGF